MKRNAVFGLLAILLVFGFVGCGTVKVAFTPTETLNEPGFILTGDSVGIFKNENPGSYEWKFFLTSGAGDTDNNLFVIKDGNTLVAKKSLSPKDYSIRVKMLGVNQNEADNGIQNIFTFTVAKEAPPPKPVDFPQNLQGTWLRKGETVGILQSADKTLIIQGSSLRADFGSLKPNFVLMGISGDTYTLTNTATDGEVTLTIKLVGGNLVVESASQFPVFIDTYLKQR